MIKKKSPKAKLRSCCRKPPAEFRGLPQKKLSFTETTPEEITAIEAMQESGRSFSFGTMFFTEAFLHKDGRPDGYSVALFYLEGNDSVADISKYRTPYLGFMQGAMHQSQLSAMYDGQFESVYLDSLEDCLPCEPGWTAIMQVH